MVRTAKVKRKRYYSKFECKGIVRILFYQVFLLLTAFPAPVCLQTGCTVLRRVLRLLPPHPWELSAHGHIVHHFHHLFHLFELLHKRVDLCNIFTTSFGNPLFA